MSVVNVVMYARGGKDRAHIAALQGSDQNLKLMGL